MDEQTKEFVLTKKVVAAIISSFLKTIVGKKSESFKNRNISYYNERNFLDIHLP